MTIGNAQLKLKRIKKIIIGISDRNLWGEKKFSEVKKSRRSLNLGGGAKKFKNFFSSKMSYIYRRIKKCKKKLPVNFFAPPPSSLCPNLNFSKHPCILVMANPFFNHLLLEIVAPDISNLTIYLSFAKKPIS